MMKIRSDLQVKYYLGLHNIDELRDDLSVLFDIIQYIIKVSQIKQKELTLDIFKFSSKSLKYIFGEKIKDETFKSGIVKDLKSLIAKDFLKVEGETLYITQTALNLFYTK